MTNSRGPDPETLSERLSLVTERLTGDWEGPPKMYIVDYETAVTGSGLPSAHRNFPKPRWTVYWHCEETITAS